MTDDLADDPAGPVVAMARHRLGTLAGPPLASQVAAVAVGLAVVTLLHLADVGRGSYAALTVMGFDPDRARLIEALTFAALASGAGALVTGRRAGPIVAAYAAVAIVFGRAFFEETLLSTGVAVPRAGFDPLGWARLGLAAAAALLDPAIAAIGGSPARSGFDGLGWAATVLALAVMTLATGWAAAILCREVRRWLGDGVALVRVARRRPLETRRLARTLPPILALALLVATLPTFADMINYTPDVAMTHQGIAAAVPLVGGSGEPSAAAASPGVPGAVTASAGGTGRAGSPIPAGIVTPASAVSAARAWVRPPAGGGTIETATLPAPWVGGNYTQSHIWIYLPAGYATSSIRYPAVYAVPWDLSHWQLGAHMTTLLDSLIGQGAIPPMVVVFIDLNGGPFPNSECADSYDGRMHADAFVARTVVAWVDAHVRTIAAAGARAILGFSQGGFCAANLQMRHPDVFANAVSFSGYFVAGFRSGDTANAWRPFGNDAAVVAANSPVRVAATLPAATRRGMFVVLSAEPDEAGYGAQAVAYADQLRRLGYPTDRLWNSLGHAWVAVRSELPAALEAVAGRMVATGVLR